MPAIATLMFVIGGFFILIGGTNPGYVARGKSIFWGTFIGVIIILCSWLIVNTILASLAPGSIAQNWTRISCTATPVIPPGPGPQPPGPQPPPTTCSDPAALAASYGVPYPNDFPRTEGVNSSVLDELISCVNSRIGNMIDQTKLYTYELSNELCNLTRGNQVCGSCAHSVNSCHYGGSSGTAGSEGVDFNALDNSEASEQELFNALQNLQSACNFGFIQFERVGLSWHTHVSTQNCDGN